MDWHKLTHGTFELVRATHFALFAGSFIRWDKKAKVSGDLEIPGDNFPLFKNRGRLNLKSGG